MQKLYLGSSTLAYSLPRLAGPTTTLRDIAADSSVGGIRTLLSD